MYKYFIVYCFENNKGKGFGNCVFETDKRIANINVIREVEAKIKENNDFNCISIINYRLMYERKEEDK